MPLESVTVWTLDGMTVGLLDRVTVQTEDGITVGLDDSVTVPDEIWIALDMANDGALESVTVLAPAVVDKPTTQDPIWEALTEIADDGVTVADEMLVVIVPDETATMLVTAVESDTEKAEDGATVATLESATTLLVRVTCTADEGATVGLDESVTVPEDIWMPLESVTVCTLEGMTVGLLESVTVQTLEGITVGLLDSVTAPEETVTVGMPEITTVALLDGMVVTAEDSVTVPDEIGIATPAVMLPSCKT
jgi:hypothetical protein